MINPAPELANQLKFLRLSGIMDSLPARNHQAIESKLAYTEFLALLVGDEVARREQKKFSSRLRRAQFRTTNTYAKHENGLQRTLDVLWVIHNFIRTHFTTKKVPAVALGILDKQLSWDELFMIPTTA